MGRVNPHISQLHSLPESGSLYLLYRKEANKSSIPNNTNTMVLDMVDKDARS
jgi:hypothetical protein